MGRDIQSHFLTLQQPVVPCTGRLEQESGWLSTPLLKNIPCLLESDFLIPFPKAEARLPNAPCAAGISILFPPVWLYVFPSLVSHPVAQSSVGSNTQCLSTPKQSRGPKHQTRYHTRGTFAHRLLCIHCHWFTPYPPCLHQLIHCTTNGPKTQSILVESPLQTAGLKPSARCTQQQCCIFCISCTAKG